jgi:hypothetical protein
MVPQILQVNCVRVLSMVMKRQMIETGRLAWCQAGRSFRSARNLEKSNLKMALGQIGA